MIKFKDKQKNKKISEKINKSDTNYKQKGEEILNLSKIFKYYIKSWK